MQSSKPYLPIGQGYPFLSDGQKRKEERHNDPVCWPKQRRNWDEVYTVVVERGVEVCRDDILWAAAYGIYE